MFVGQLLPSGHVTFIQRCRNVGAMSWSCINVKVTLYSVSAGLALELELANAKIESTYFLLVRQ